MLDHHPSATGLSAAPTTPTTPTATLPPDAATPATILVGHEPPADEGPLAGLTDEAVAANVPDGADADPALQPRATIFFTPHGRALLEQIDAFQAFVELPSAAHLHARVEAAADALASRAGRGILLLSGGHYTPGSLMQFHAAIDACQKHSWPLLVEMHTVVLQNLQARVRILEARPQLRRRLGTVALASRAGQRIAWDYVRRSGHRGTLQRLLPEVLACLDIRRSGVRLVHVDPLGLHGGSNTQREAWMVGNTDAALQQEDKAVLVLGLNHAMPMQQELCTLGIACREIALLDESANQAARLFDRADDRNPVYQMALAHSQALRQPGSSLAASQTDTFRLPANLDPFR